MIKWLEKNRGISLIITFLIAIEIFYFSSLLGVTGTGGNIWFSRIYHFSVFFLFSFFFFATIKGHKEIKIKHILIVIIISIVYGIVDEVHQLFVPLRCFSIKDILTNTLGIFSSIIIYLYVNKNSIFISQT
jgi:VanZ family protein